MDVMSSNYDVYVAGALVASVIICDGRRNRTPKDAAEIVLRSPMPPRPGLDGLREIELRWMGHAGVFKLLDNGEIHCVTSKPR